jgi:hypothetical protein
VELDRADLVALLETPQPELERVREDRRQRGAGGEDGDAVPGSGLLGIEHHPSTVVVCGLEVGVATVGP